MRALVLLREADHRLGLTESLARRLVDPRRQELIRYQLVELLRERLYALAQGYSAQDDADRLAHDPSMKLAVWDRPVKGVCACAVTKRLYVTTRSKLYCLDLLSEKTLWETSPPNGTDRMSITPDGRP